jgi:3-hydroxymyristoyl/3-hydroxydecanoyl-(acyl carrier protein) dehydratase
VAAARKELARVAAARRRLANGPGRRALRSAWASLDKLRTSSATNHRSFLLARAEAMRAMATGARQVLGEAAGNARSRQGTRTPGLIWDANDLLEFAGGSIARVFGPRYAAIDGYRRRVRLPLPPYLLVSRVTALDAKLGSFRPSSVVTEYDVPTDAWYAVDGQVPWSVATEAGQCDLLLISYLGIDFENRGERVYRLLDTTITFLDDLPTAGSTLRYEIHIDRFTRSEVTTLFFFSYDCFVGDRPIIRMRGGCAGFFGDDELDRAAGIVPTSRERAERARITPRQVEPLLRSARRALDREDLLRLTRGDVSGCFGPAYAQGDRNHSLRLGPPALLMFDRVVALDPRGGAWGLGEIVAEKDLRPDDWYFPCHFQDDQVLAGTLVTEGCSQLLQLYLLFVGAQTRTMDGRFRPIPGLAQSVRCRGQITPKDARLTYRLEVTDLGLEDEPFIRANVDVALDEKVVVAFRDLGMRTGEWVASAARTLSPGLPAARPAPAFDERQIAAAATGSLIDCFGPDFAIYDGRRAPRTPNGPLQLIHRVVSVKGTRMDFRPGSNLVAEVDLPADPWFCPAGAPADIPYAILMEIGLQPCGFLSAHLGSTLLHPEADLYFRNLDGRARLLRAIDPRAQTIRTRVRLLSSIDVGGTILQTFAFRLEAGSSPFYEGEAVFGYFGAADLARQTGLDDATVVEPSCSSEAITVAAGAAAHPYLDLLSDVLVCPTGGRTGLGHAASTREIDPTSWFFAAHFHQDPVMPGSLGIEALYQAMRACGRASRHARAFKAPRFVHPVGRDVVWKYRGQITRGDRRMRVEAHITGIHDDGDRVTLVADGDVWKDERRIYAISGAALVMVEGE